MLSQKYIKEDTTFKPQLTSLVDVMTILLVFLLKSFSAEGQLVTPSKDLNLPISTAKKTPKLTLMIEASTSSISFGDDKISDLNVNDSILIEKLYRYGKENFNKKDLDKSVIIQIDSQNNFRIARLVMKGLNRLGAKKFSILVVQED